MTVQISEGLYLSDKNARIFAQHMMADLQRYNDRVFDYMDLGDIRASLGNPTGQRRFFKRFTKLLGPTYLRGHLQPGKNKKFCLDYMTFLAAPDGLLLATVYIAGHGAGNEIRHDSVPIIAFSVHALQRLIQRAGVRTGDDYLPILKAISVPSFVAAGAAGNNLAAGQSWPLPVRVNDRRVLLLLKLDPQTNLPTITTAYPGTWRTGQEIDALETLLGTFDLYAHDWDGIEPYRAAFIAASRYFKEAVVHDHPVERILPGDNSRRSASVGAAIS